MAVKGAFTFLEMVKRLTRGYIKATGRKPDNLAKLKINMEAAQRVKQQNVVTEFPKDKITPFHIPRPIQTKEKGFIPMKAEQYRSMFGKSPKKPTVVQNRRAEFLKKYTKDGQPNDVELNALANEHRILSAEAKKLGDAGENYEKFSQLNKRTDEIQEILDFMNKEFPEGMASGGLARVGYAGGRLVKGASWVINKLKEQLFDMDLGIGGSRFSKLSSTQKDFYKKELNTLIKQLEQGGEIPKEMLDTMIADPKFKSVVKTRSTDKDLYDLEDALLDHQAGKQADQIVDDVFGPFDADGKLNKKAVLQEVKDSEEKMLLDRFNVKDRKPNASGGLAHILGV